MSVRLLVAFGRPPSLFSQLLHAAGFFPVTPVSSRRELQHRGKKQRLDLLHFPGDAYFRYSKFKSLSFSAVTIDDCNLFRQPLLFVDFSGPSVRYVEDKVATHDSLA